MFLPMFFFGQSSSFGEKKAPNKNTTKVKTNKNTKPKTSNTNGKPPAKAVCNRKSKIDIAD